MRIGVVTPWEVENPRSWSGVVKPMVDALRGLGEVVPFVTGGVPDSVVDRGLARLIDGRFGRRYLVGHALATAIKRGRSLSKRLESRPVDVIVAIAASQDLAFLNTSIPVIQVSDTTLKAIRDFYPIFSNLNPVSAWQASIQSSRSAQRATHTLAATDWARDALIRDDRLPPDSVTVAPFGPAVAPPKPVSPKSLPPGPIRILMVSSDWNRKGGPDVIRVCEELRRTATPFELTVVGDTPPLPPWVRSLGRVSRDNMAKAYENADVLLEMATSNAAGVVLTDAMHFGLPVVATDTGGVSSIVADGVTGVLVGKGDASAAASAIRQLRDQGSYARMSAAALHRAHSSLSWRAWGAAAGAAMDAVTADRPSGAAIRVVSLSPAIPYPGIEHAGGQYLWRLHTALEGTHHLTWVTQDRPSTLHALAQPGVVPDVRLLADRSVAKPWHQLVYQTADRVEAVVKKADSQPVPLGALIDMLCRPDIRRLVRGADVLDFQWEGWSRLAPWARLINRRARLIFTFHDVQSQKCRREADKAPDRIRRLRWQLAGAWARAWERRALALADHVLVFSAKDRDLLPRAPARKVVVIDPPLADGEPPQHIANDAHRVLMVGFMARQENVDGLLWFAREVWPLVRAAIPNAEFHVVGGAMSPGNASQFRGNHDGIILRGFVPDIADEYAQASVAVVPLLHGAGVKFKTIEALLAGVPVVTTSIGAEGIGGAGLFSGLTDLSDTFAQAVVEALVNNPLAVEQARVHQSAVWSRYSALTFATAIRGVYSAPGSPLGQAGDEAR